jgi:zinc protease
MKGFIENRSADPESAFYDTIMVTMAQYHPRVRPWSEEVLDEMDMEKSFGFYRDRFADASDFTFFLVGSFTLDELRPLVTTYLGNLPCVKRKESWKDTGIIPPEGVIKKEVYKGIEPKSRVSLYFSGPFEFSRENRYMLNSMTSVLRIKLREVLREDLGGTYGVSVGSSGTLHPRQEYRVSINFGCSPDRVEEMISNIFRVMDTLRTEGPGEDYIQKIGEQQRRSYETSLKENGFWLQSLYNAYYLGRDPVVIYRYPELIDTLSEDRIREAAVTYLNEENYVQVILYPEGSQ